MRVIRRFSSHAPRPIVLLATAAGALALAPGVAHADVPVAVPDRFLGGPISAPLPVVGPVSPSGVAGRPSPSPPRAGDGCMGVAEGGCVAWGPAAETDLREEIPELGPAPPDGTLAPPPAPVAEDPGAGEPEPAVDLTPVPVVPIDEDPSAAGDPLLAAPALPPGASDAATAFGRLLAPGAASWLRWRTPVLRWRPDPGATHYNVQVFRGGRRVLNAWPSSARLRVPDGVLRQGRTYVWTVWPGRGPRPQASYGAPLGRATFQLTLRPRIVFRAAGPLRGGLVAEVRPHIPFGTLHLAAPAGLAGRVPPQVTIDARGRFALPLPRRAGERLRARLVARGPAPPIGLRG